MAKRMLSLSLVWLLLNVVCHQSVTAGPTSKEVKFAAKVEAAVAKLGTGPGTHVELQLRDKTKLKGYLSEANNEGFTIVEEKTGVATKIDYHQVRRIKGRNLSTGVKIAIGVGIAVFIIVGLVQIFHSNG